MAGCTGCGAAVKAGSKSCEYCGTPVEMGELQSILTFVEDREKRIHEAKLREAETARAAHEAEVLRQRWGLRVLVLIGVACVLFLGLMALYEKRAERNTTAMPVASKELKGHNCQDVKTELQSAGFTSVETVALPDLKIGLFNKPGEVEEVSVNGRTDFDAESRFPTDARILIRYHTFPEKK